jgi:hypothetical protein
MEVVGTIGRRVAIRLLSPELTGARNCCCILADVLAPLAKLKCKSGLEEQKTTQNVTPANAFGAADSTAKELLVAHLQQLVIKRLQSSHMVRRGREQMLIQKRLLFHQPSTRFSTVLCRLLWVIHAS